MRTARKRPDRGACIGWDGASARLEDRLLLSGGDAGAPARPTVRPSPPADSAIAGATATSADPSPAGAAAVVAGATAPAVAFTAGTFDITTLPTGVGSSSMTSGGLAWASRAPDNLPGPALIGQATASGASGPVLARMEDFLTGYHPVGDSALGIIAADPRSSCASMASIVGGSGVEVLVFLDEPQEPPPVVGDAVATLPAIEAEADVGEEPNSLATAGLGWDRPPAEAGAESSTTRDESDDRLALPSPIGLGLRLAAPCLDPAAWDRAVRQIVEGLGDPWIGLDGRGGDAPYFPWIVVSALALAASEVARRARPRPRFASAFVDGPVDVGIASPRFQGTAR